MTYLSFANYAGMSIAAADIVEDLLSKHPEAHFVLATGGSPEGLYAEMVRRGLSLASAYVTKLDDWAGIRPDDPRSCESYLRERVLVPLRADVGRYLSFDGMALNHTAECQRVSEELRGRPRVDMAILGIGKNGHIAMNEPAEALQPHCHVATLAPSTREHPMLAGPGGRPTHGLTLGMADLLAAKHILLLVSGEGKMEAFERLKDGLVTPAYPATFLHLHSDVVCLECLG